MVYVATDNSGLTSTCSFEFEVEGRLSHSKSDEGIYLIVSVFFVNMDFSVMTHYYITVNELCLDASG